MSLMYVVKTCGENDFADAQIAGIYTTMDLVMDAMESICSIEYVDMEDEYDGSTFMVETWEQNAQPHTAHVTKFYRGQIKGVSFEIVEIDKKDAGALSMNDTLSFVDEFANELSI